METDTTQNNYFTSYEDLEIMYLTQIHRLMLEDNPRTETYRKAILENASYFKDKIVMDVGCGTGILSIFCAQAGAKKVYAVEPSNLAFLAKQIVKENNFEEFIEVIHSKVEDVSLPGNIKVDALVSEWMGFYLLHEGMLDSVLYARDKFLKPDGEMFPDSACIYVAPCSVPELYKWNNFHGVNLSAFANQLRSSKNSKPEIMTIQKEDLLGPGTVIAWLNLKEDKVSDLESFNIEEVIGVTRNGHYQGICIWFECYFPQISAVNRIILSTGPESPATHWKQTIILLPEEQSVDEEEPIAYGININRDLENSRRYNIQLSLLDPDEVEHPVPCTCYMTKCILMKTVMQQNADHIISQRSAKSNILEEDNIDDDD